MPTEGELERVSIMTESEEKEIAAKLSSDNDRGFYRRVWETPETVYGDRIRQLGFEGLELVVDAGAGFGQWSLPLARLNQAVVGIDIDRNRVEIAAFKAAEAGLDNLKFVCSGLTNSVMPEASVDAVFSYSVIYYTDWERTLESFYYWLRPGGKLYFTTNGLGWYLHNIINRHNDAADFDSRTMGIETIANTFVSLSGGSRREGTPVAMDSKAVLAKLLEIGFEDVKIGPDASLGEGKGYSCRRFYEPEFYGVEANFEVLCRKPN